MIRKFTVSKWQHLTTKKHFKIVSDKHSFTNVHTQNQAPLRLLDPMVTSYALSRSLLAYTSRIYHLQVNSSPVQLCQAQTTPALYVPAKLTICWTTKNKDPLVEKSLRTYPRVRNDTGNLDVLRQKFQLGILQSLKKTSMRLTKKKSNVASRYLR